MIRKTWYHCRALTSGNSVVVIGVYSTYWFIRMVTNWSEPWNPGVTESPLMTCSDLVWSDKSDIKKRSCWFLMRCYWFKVTWVAGFCCLILCVLKYICFFIPSIVHYISVSLPEIKVMWLITLHNDCKTSIQSLGFNLLW